MDIYREWCDNHNIFEVPFKWLKDCFEIPPAGLRVRDMDGNDQCYKPIVPGQLADGVFEKLGKYNDLERRVIFVNRDGRTFLAKGNGIIPVLRDAGYEKDTSFSVPMARGERILVPLLATVWEKIPVKE